MKQSSTEKKLLKEADNRVTDTIKVLASAKTSVVEGATALEMNLGHQFMKLYEAELAEINDKFADLTSSLSSFAKKIRTDLKQ